MICIQLLAVLLLQGYGTLPLVRAHTAPEKKCFGNHLLCGCAPERIAARNCCCFENAHSCCLKAMSVAADEYLASKTHEKARHGISSLPCGGYTDTFTELSEKVKFLTAGFDISPPEVVHTSHHVWLPSAPPDRHLEPPVPPPRLSASV